MHKLSNSRIIVSKRSWKNVKKYLLIIFSALFLIGCSDTEGGSGKKEAVERKDSITNEETMEYFERLVSAFVETNNLESEDQIAGVMEKIEQNSNDVVRELKREYEKDIHAVDDLISLADLFKDMVKDVNEGNAFLLKGYSEDIGKKIGAIAIDYLDGDLPESYVKIIGVDNVYDLK